MKKGLAAITLALMLAACGSASNTDNAAADTDTHAASKASSAKSTSNQQSAGDDTGFSGQKAKRSYALGMDIGSSVGDLPFDMDVDALLQGVRDVVTDAQARLSQQEKKVTLKNLLKEIQSAQAEKAKQSAQTNLKASKAFLAENKTKQGVHVTDSGLQYKVLKKGEGPKPDRNDKVTVHYTGKLIDGTVFDSSRKRGKPVTFPVSGVIRGWTEALQMMHEGARYKLFIPPKLAYGKRGAGAKIGPNQALIFEVELIKVHPKEGDGS